MYTRQSLPVLFSLLIFASSSLVDALCGSNIRWSHQFNMEYVYGMWYGVGYAQHNPDMTNKPNRIGCVTLYIADATTETKDVWMNWPINPRNYTEQNWRSYKDNPWSNTPLSGSWLDVRLKRRAKRNLYDERRLRIIWDEDGQSMEQTYVYSMEEPGLWTAEHWRPMEREMKLRGVGDHITFFTSSFLQSKNPEYISRAEQRNVWYPDDPPRHPEVIRVLKVTPELLIINHCSETGDGGVFSLILRRSPSVVEWWEWHELQKQFYNYELPRTYRHVAVCGACHVTSTAILLICGVFLRLTYFINVLT